MTKEIVSNIWTIFHLYLVIKDGHFFDTNFSEGCNIDVIDVNDVIIIDINEVLIIQKHHPPKSKKNWEKRWRMRCHSRSKLREGVQKKCIF